MRDLAKQTYVAVGKCIYCGAVDDLTDEHIIPLALNGSAILPKSSCLKCAKITGQFEQQVLRGILWPLRVAKGLKSRTKHRDAPKARTVKVTDQAGVTKDVEVAFGQPPFAMIVPLFSPPACYEPEAYTTGIRVKGLATYGIGASQEEILNQYRARRITWTDTSHPIPFARMIAKIAYAAAYADNALDHLVGPSVVLSSILDDPDDIGRWVGGANKPFEVHKGHLHRIIYGETQSRFLVAEVQLFADSGLPTYSVVLGKQQADATNRA
jgi:hypothetical protein